MQIPKTIACFFVGAIFFTSCKSTKLFCDQSNGAVKNELNKWLLQIADYTDDPAAFDSVWSKSDTFCVHIGEPYFLVPSAELPKGLDILRSNNNVSVTFFKHRLYVAFRTSPTHFASKKTGVYILSSADAETWTKEMELFPNRDVREPFLQVFDSVLRFYSFEAGTKMTSFEPHEITCYSTSGNGKWSIPQRVLHAGEVHWSMKSRKGVTYLSSYEGSHYELKGPSKVSLHFSKTSDGLNFYPIGDNGVVYIGGVSETDFEFDKEGNLWAVTRLEDGDSSGFGSHVVYASKNNIAQWQFPSTADPNCYMSPKVFRQGNDIFLIARKQLGKKPFGYANSQKSMRYRRLHNWINFSLSPKTTALYRINKHTHQVEWLTDLPGAGDTAFPSILRLDSNRLLVANYSSPLRFKKRSWLCGQLGRTGIYLTIISFDNCGK